MIITTTSDISGRAVAQYLGIVTGEIIVGANIFKDMFASVRDVVGGRSGSYEDVLREARLKAMTEMQAAAQKLAADAVIGVTIDIESVGSTSTMLMVMVAGTAIKLA